MRKKEPEDINEMLVWGVNEIRKAGFGQRTAYRLLNRPDFPSFRIGNRRFVLRESFKEWLRQQEGNDKRSI